MKKMMIIALAGLLFVACKKEEATPYDLTEAKAAIAESNKTYGEGFAKGDASLFTSNYTKDGCIMPANAPKLCGAEALGMFFKGAQSMGVKNIVLTTEEVMGGPEAVVETGTYELLGEANKSLDKGKFIVVWKMEDGKWKMHRDIFNTSVPVPVAK
jgi:ketosteroid isomerase-like protein